MPDGNLSKEELLRLLREQMALSETLKATIAELRLALDAQQAASAAQSRTIAGLNATVAELQETIRELQRQLGRNSRNSSQPPSKDDFNKPRPQSLRKRSGLKQGGQPGHAGSHMAIPHEPDDVQQHLPSKCLSCPRLAECRKGGMCSPAAKGATR